MLYVSHGIYINIASMASLSRRLSKLVGESARALRHREVLAQILGRHRRGLPLARWLHRRADHLEVLLQRLTRMHLQRLSTTRIALLQEELQHLLIDSFAAFQRLLQKRVLSAVDWVLGQDQTILKRQL